MKKKTPRSRRKIKLVEHTRSSSAEFTNREMGWLQFNLRVLNEAEDSRNPLLERLRFLAIAFSNLDEFFMKRVGRLKRHIAFGLTPKSSDGKTPVEELHMIRKSVKEMQKKMADLYSILVQELRRESVLLLQWNDLNEAEKSQVKKFYNKNVFPVLTPLSVDPGHPFPFISNLSISLGITLKHPDREEKFFARLKIPKVLPQWIKVETDGKTLKFVSLLEVIKANLNDLFPSMMVLQVLPFRITRNADIDHDEEETSDLLELIEEELRQRRFADVVRMEHGPHPDPWILKFLMDELELAEDDLYEHSGPLDISDLHLLADLPLPTLKFENFSAVVPPAFSEETQSVFQAIKHQDHLIHHPFESFRFTVERFIREASQDPKVLAIKMTLYRTGDNSPFIKSLIRAAEQGKQVVCLVELKARFDEERNIYWAQELENAGVHVVYGVVGLKTHAKTALVVRQETDGLKCYAHIGTGNYNSSTSRQYTDLGLLTANDEITNELVEFFHYLTGRSLKTNYDRLLIAPINMSQKFKAMIDREGENAKLGKPAHIIAKFNNMEENDLALQLYSAAQKGCDIDLIVRGFCCLKPGVPGLSEKIRVISVIGRFLEHSRIFYFRNAAVDPVDGEFFIGSADWMYRNLHGRLEAVTPIVDRSLREKCWEILQLYLKDQRQTWDMNSEGFYQQRKSPQDPGVHQVFMNLSKQRAKLNENTAEVKES